MGNDGFAQVSVQHLADVDAVLHQYRLVQPVFLEQLGVAHIVDAAFGALSSLTSQPNLESVVAALALAADQPWPYVSLRDIAVKADVPFAALYALADSKAAADKVAVDLTAITVADKVVVDLTAIVETVVTEEEMVDITNVINNYTESYKKPAF